MIKMVKINKPIEKTTYTCDICGCRYNSLEEAEECENLKLRKVGEKIYSPKSPIARNNWEVGSLVGVLLTTKGDEDYSCVEYGIVTDTEVIGHFIYPIVFLPELNQNVRHKKTTEGYEVKIIDPLRGEYNHDKLKYVMPTLEEYMKNKVMNNTRQKLRHQDCIKNLDAKIAIYNKVLIGEIPELKR